VILLLVCTLLAGLGMALLTAPCDDLTFSASVDETNGVKCRIFKNTKLRREEES
jgi:hypothetical protein